MTLATDYNWSLWDGLTLIPFESPEALDAYVEKRWPAFWKGKISGFWVDPSKPMQRRIFSRAWRQVYDLDGNKVGTIHWTLQKPDGI